MTETRRKGAAKRAITGGVSDSPTMPRTPATLIIRVDGMGQRTIREPKNSDKMNGRSTPPAPYRTMAIRVVARSMP